MAEDLTRAPIPADHLKLIKDTVFKDGTDDELKLFYYVSRKRNLDPIMREIYAVKRWDNNLGRHRVTFQTGIDGLRIIAARTGQYAGSDDPIFSYAEDDKKRLFPVSATTTIYRLVAGTRCPFTATARWSEYCPAPPNDFMWKTRRHIMLGKCSEALALRKGFPDVAAGLYAKEEMERADFSDPVERPRASLPHKDEPTEAATPVQSDVIENIADERAVPPDKGGFAFDADSDSPASERSKRKMYALVQETVKGASKEEKWSNFKAFLKSEIGYEGSTKDMTQSQVNDVIMALEDGDIA